MEANSLDVSVYQEYLYGVVSPENLRPIDWGLVAQDERKFKFAYIKSSHGKAIPGIHKDAYPVASWMANRDGARKAGILPGPYHYWYWKLGGVAVGSIEQASAFWETVKADPGDIPPQVDIEDTSIFPDVEPVIWTTAEANRCLQNAVVILNAIAVLLEEVSNRFKCRAVPYCGKWYWDRLVGQVRYYAPKALEFAREYGWYAADYGSVRQDVPEWHEIIWQYTSTAYPPVKGVQVLGGTRVDLCRWVGTEADYEELTACVGSPVPPEELSFEEKVNRLWAAHPGL